MDDLNSTPAGEPEGEAPMELGEYDSFASFENPKEIVEYMLNDENFSSGFKAFREIAEMIAENPNDWFYMNWAEIEEELTTFPEIPLEAILMQGIQSVFKVASLKVKKNKKPKKPKTPPFYTDDEGDWQGGDYF